jgi:hypothetical protein
MKRLALELLTAAMLAVLLPVRAHGAPFAFSPQTDIPDPGGPCPELTYAYVDPIWGVDPPVPPAGSLANLLVRLNDPTRPFRTIQLAIDVCQYGVEQRWLTASAADQPKLRGVVLCMPGLYGPAGVQAGPTDTFPIVIRDRVSVQGQGARRTVLRGTGVVDPLQEYFWPKGPACGVMLPAEVLVDFSSQHLLATNPLDPPFQPLAWTQAFDPQDSEEMLDGFCLQGGDFQVYVRHEGEQLGRVSNCLFDMRDDPEATRGPYIGILMAHAWDPNTFYKDIQLNVLNNTFVMGEGSSSEPLMARPEAVGIIAVNDPLCINGVPGAGTDPIPRLRGVGNPSIQNNLLRTLPEQSLQKEMLGVDSTDTAVSGGTNPGTTNAFHASRVGGDNGFFHSAMLPGNLLPLPQVDLDFLPNDPSFVGETLAPLLTNPAYRDWRLLPGTPMQDVGSAPDLTVLPVALVAVNGTSYAEPECPVLSCFDWDGELYGNPRLVNEVDIGFDEVHLMIMAGNWANDANNHNLPEVPTSPPGLDPNAGAGAPVRHMLFPGGFAGGGVRVNGTDVAYGVFAPTGSVPAWTCQPGTIDPPSIGAGFPPFHQARYIAFNNPAPTPTPWTGTLTTLTLTNPVSLVPTTLGYKLQTDTEGSVPATYFNAQAVVTTLGGVSYRSNLQSEYR